MIESIKYTLKIGDKINLGNFNQTVDARKATPISWTVAEEREDCYLLISDKILDTCAFGLTNDYLKSQLRQYLENFHNFAFDDLTGLQLLPHPELGDYAFALSTEELNKLSKDLQCTSFTDSCHYTNFYWLRSPNPSHYGSALVVYTFGSGYHANTNYSNGGVRPAILLSKITEY